MAPPRQVRLSEVAPHLYQPIPRSDPIKAMKVTKKKKNAGGDKSETSGGMGFWANVGQKAAKKAKEMKAVTGAALQKVATVLALHLKEKTEEVVASVSRAVIQIATPIKADLNRIFQPMPINCNCGYLRRNYSEGRNEDLRIGNDKDYKQIWSYMGIESSDEEEESE